MSLSVCSADSAQVEFRTQRHVQLFRRLQAQWQCYDAYARLTFTNSLRWYHLSEIASIYVFSVIRCCFRPPFSSAIVTRQTQYKPEKTWRKGKGWRVCRFSSKLRRVCMSLGIRSFVNQILAWLRGRPQLQNPFGFPCLFMFGGLSTVNCQESLDCYMATRCSTCWTVAKIFYTDTVAKICWKEIYIYIVILK